MTRREETAELYCVHFIFELGESVVPAAVLSPVRSCFDENYRASNAAAESVN